MEEIKNLKIKDLKKSEYNPRKITEQELKKLENSIKNFGFVVPIVINQNPDRMNIVISGHQRIKVAEKMGKKEVPCMSVELDITKERALNLALNKISGEFEEEQLTDLLMKIEEENEDVLSLTGFNNEEVNYLLGLGEKEKERIFAVRRDDSTAMADLLGTIKWGGSWRQYIFLPLDLTGWSKGCLKEICDFLDEINKKHRAKWKR